MSYKTKLTSGNEADHNQSGMKEVKVETTTEKEKAHDRMAFPNFMTMY